MTENYEDESLLSVENETELIELLKKRYQNGNQFSFIDDIAVFVNPCKTLNKEDPKDNLYQNVAKSSLHHLRCHTKNQCILLCGESGAGKTELANQLIEFITKTTSSSDQELADYIIKAGKLLESFGNASTATSSNASRFVKLTELFFTENIQLRGVYFHHYLLEKSRLVRCEKGEKNFHIFYQFLGGSSEENLQKYNILTSVYHRCVGRDIAESQDKEKYQEELNYVEECLKALGFSQDNVETIYRIIAAIVHIADLRVIANPKSKAVQIGDFETLQQASSLLGVTPERLQFAFVTEMTYVKGRIARRARRENEVCHARDMLVMALYTRLFAWIVWNINQYLSPYSNTASNTAVSILDPFGFERLGSNSFEQLCINTTNEHLKFLYNQVVFAWELADQETEGILIQKLDFTNNSKIIDYLMERPDGIFSLIEQESKSLKGTDVGLVKKITNKHRKNVCYSDSPNCPYPVFCINHYAGKVMYDAVDILNKNKDMLGGSLITCMQESEDDLIYRLFMVKLSPTGAILRADRQSTTNVPSMPRKAEMKKMRPTVRRQAEMIGNIHGLKTKNKVDKKKLIQEQAYFTLTSQFRNSLSDLMQRNLNSELHFICCLRPNKDLTPNQFDDDFVNAQLRHSGIMDTVTMRQDGYPIRLSFKIFIERYKMLSHRLTAELKYNESTCEKILSHVDGLGWKMGKTRVFMKSRCMKQLDDLLDAALQAVVIVQKLFRGRQSRRIFKLLKIQHQRDKDDMVEFITQAHGNIDRMHDHLQNQVIEEDARALYNIKQSQEDIKEKALQILDGSKPRQRKLTNPLSSSKGMSSPAGESSTRSPQNQHATPSSSSMTEKDNKMDENQNDIKEHTPQAQPLLSITDMFGPVGEMVASSEATTSDNSEKIRNNNDELSIENQLSVMDVFSNERSVNDSQSEDRLNDEKEPTSEELSITDLFDNSKASTYSEETSEEISITDVFSTSRDKDLETSAHVSISDIMSRPSMDDVDAPDDLMTSPERPPLVGRESNLSTFSFDNALSPDDDIHEVGKGTPGIWCVISCYERDQSRGEFQVDRSVIIVDGSSNAFDVTRIGIGSLPMNPADEQVDKVRRCIGKGIKLTIDVDGDVWVKRSSKNKVYVKGCFVSSEIKETSGELPKEKLIKVFDFEAFSDHLKHECDPMRYEPGRGDALLSSTKVYFSFVKDAVDDIDTPCWIEVTIAEPYRIAEVSLDMAKDRRRQARERRGERTPPILRAKIGKSRQVIAVGAWEKQVRPNRYIDSFKFGRRDWARKKVSFNPFEYGEQGCFSPRDNEARVRSKSSPVQLNTDGGMRDEPLQDEVFESNCDSVAKKNSAREKDVRKESSSSSTGKVWAKVKLKAKEEQKLKSRARAKTATD